MAEAGAMKGKSKGQNDLSSTEDWIDKNQLARRNLMPDQMAILRGRRYNRGKRQGARTDLTYPQNEEKLKTSERLAKEYSVSRATTIKRDGQVAEYLNARPDDCQGTRGDSPLKNSIDEKTRSENDQN